VQHSQTGSHGCLASLRDGGKATQGTRSIFCGTKNTGNYLNAERIQQFLPRAYEKDRRDLTLISYWKFRVCTSAAYSPLPGQCAQSAPSFAPSLSGELEPLDLLAQRGECNQVPLTINRENY